MTANVACVCSARWRGQPEPAGGQGVAQPAGTPRGGDNGCAGQGGAVGFSPETAGGGDEEKFGILLLLRLILLVFPMLILWVVELTERTLLIHAIF
jgi:hypothetical protein